MPVPRNLELRKYSFMIADEGFTVEHDGKEVNREHVCGHVWCRAFTECCIAVPECRVVGDQIVHRISKEPFAHAPTLKRICIIEHNDPRTLDFFVFDFARKLRAVYQDHVKGIDPVLSFDRFNGSSAYAPFTHVLNIMLKPLQHLLE